MRFRDLSFKSKFVLLTSALCLFSVILCTCGFLRQERMTLQRESVQQTLSLSRMLAFNSDLIAEHRDAESGAQLLAGLKHQSEIEAAAIYAHDGRLIAQVTYTGSAPAKVADIEPSLSMSAAFHLEVVEPIFGDGHQVGAIYVRSNLASAYEKMQGQMSVAIAVGALSLLATILLSAFLQKLISAPILTLAHTAKSITDAGDYSVRVSHKGDDEIGTLYSSFNQLLERVDETEQKLKSYNDDLELRVNQRTAELQESIRQHEITERQLMAAKHVAEEASQVKSEFLANMSHEIRTPMNAIIGFTDLLLDDDVVDRDKRTSYLRSIETGGRHLLSLINDILDISKIEAGCMEVRPVDCSPHDLVVEIASVMRASAEEKGVGLDYIWKSDIPDQINTDPDRFKQVLINLIGNAVKFTRQGGVRVVLKLVSVDGRPMLRVNVVDTGIGIPANKLEKIFDPFTQADSTTTRDFGGTGLGLTICRRIAEALGGSLRAESQLGAGSVFTLLMDAGPMDGVRMRSNLEVSTKDAPEPGLVKLPDRVTFVPQQTRILLVEDGDTNRKLIRLMLEKAGIEVDDAINGKLGFEKALENSYDLILMDMQMPVMDGYTAVRLLREHGYSKPVIALTAHAMNGDREKCLNAGCTDYLTKPIDGATLTQSVRRWVADCKTQSPAPLELEASGV